MKIRPVGAELFHADGKTDMTELTVAFRNFSNDPKNHCSILTMTLEIVLEYVADLPFA
jgi:hypothetical protein